MTEQSPQDHQHSWQIVQLSVSLQYQDGTGTGAFVCECGVYKSIRLNRITPEGEPWKSLRPTRPPR